VKKDGRGVFKNAVSRRLTLPAVEGKKWGKLQNTIVGTTVRHPDKAIPNTNRHMYHNASRFDLFFLWMLHLYNTPIFLQVCGLRSLLAWSWVWIPVEVWVYVPFTHLCVAVYTYGSRDGPV